MKGSEPPVVYGGGNGDSYMESITISVGENTSPVGAEHYYVSQIWGIRGHDWNILKQQLHKVDGRHYDKLILKLAGGLERYAFFDITDCFEPA